jgi:hypothetical protein
MEELAGDQLTLQAVLEDGVWAREQMESVRVCLIRQVLLMCC